MSRFNRLCVGVRRWGASFDVLGTWSWLKMSRSIAKRSRKANCCTRAVKIGSGNFEPHSRDEDNCLSWHSPLQASTLHHSEDF
ncbi:hypothetical protein TNCV_5015861 [Trichonephila clavipes]|nr:hypothetical protein TNCV_5015861 [Trichonephila clavipes]